MARARIPLIPLLAFEATARLGRQSAAAAELGVTSGAISRHIRNLEAHLGLALMAGTRRDPSLTPAARLLADALSPAFDSILDAMTAAKDESHAILDVACLGTFAMRWLIPRLAGFQSLHPDIDVRLSTSEPLQAFQSRRCDVAILVIDEQSKPLVGDVLLLEEKMTVVVGSALAAKHRLQSPQQLPAVPRLVSLTRPNAWSLWLTGKDEALAALATGSHPYEHYTFAIEAAANGLGACAVPEHLVWDDLASGRLVAPFPSVPTGYRYLARCRDPRNRISQVFCQWLKSQCA